MGKILKNGIFYAGGGAEGKSAYQTWLDLGNEGTEQDFIDSLGGGGSSLYVVTGSLDIENEDNSVILNQTFEEIKTAYDEGKTIIADILVAGEAQYIFNLLYVLEDAIAFEWINSAAKTGGQINLMNDNTVTFAMTSLEGSDAIDTLVITGNYAVDEDNWVVSNIDKTFAEIDEAITNNQDVVLKIYPEGDTTNPYILHPAMHYANMGTAFSLTVSDEGQISGLSVMITADNQVMASRNVYDFNKLNENIPIIENGKEVVQHKITKNRSITELESYTDPNGGTGYKIDDLYLTYDCEKLAKGIDDWLAEKGITPVKGETYEDVAQIQVYSESGGGYVYFSTHMRFDNTTYLIYEIKYNDTDYAIISVQYDHTNGKTPTTFTGLNVFNIAKIIPELAGCYIQSDILDVLHNWFELYKPIGLEDSVGLYSKQEALTTQDLIVNAPIESRTVGAFDLGNIVSLMTSPLQKLLFSVDSEGKNLKAFANDEKKRTTTLTNGLFSGNLLASKNIFATLNDMTTLPTPPDGALGIWTVVPDAPGQPESTNKGGTLIIAHITSMLYSQTINYIGTRIAIYVTQGAIYYALGYGGKYYPTASWTPASGGAFRWYKISSTLV